MESDMAKNWRTNIPHGLKTTSIYIRELFLVHWTAKYKKTNFKQKRKKKGPFIKYYIESKVISAVRNQL